MKIRIVVTSLLVVCALIANAQQLKPGFDADEYMEMLLRSAMHASESHRGGLPQPANYDRVYSSPVVGMHNKWELWLSKDKKIMVVNLRGTTADKDSWIENFYSAMVPATGSIKLSDSLTYNYKFAADPKAAVHIGWTIGACFMLPDIADKIRTYYARGARQLIVEGHSQGGALAFLVSSDIHYQMEAGKLPKDIVMKTYCSAAPKPGNLFYAYDFDFITRGGWAFTVVNAVDWVPETPFTMQTLKDVNTVNPFSGAKTTIRKQKFIARLALMHAYNRLSKSTTKAQRTYERYLGRITGKQVKKFIPGYEPPAYVHVGNYMRAGNPVVLQPDAAYYKSFPDTGSNLFRNHMFAQYYFLTKKIYK